MPAIETRGLTKRYRGDVYAVDDLDLTVQTGEVFGFLGPNGAGKSTTIDVLLDYVRPTAGRATVLGYDAQAEADAVHDRVGVLPDGYSLYDRLSGREHLSYAIDLKGTDDDPDELLRRVGLDETAGQRRAGAYSKGMRQRLALGIALVGDPELLILDEPSSGLDPDGIRDIREITREHAESGGTVFFSSHVLSQVEAVCDRVGILSRGRLVATDTIDGLRETLGTGATLSVTVDALPTDLDVGGIAGVSAVTVEDDTTVTGNRSGEGTTITATCEGVDAKLRVLDAIRNSEAELLDFEAREASLEDLFRAYVHTDSTGVQR